MNRVYYDLKLKKWVRRLPTYKITRFVTIKQHRHTKYEHVYGRVVPRAIYFEPSNIGKRAKITIEIEGVDMNGNKSEIDEATEDRKERRTNTRTNTGSRTRTGILTGFV